ncbi:nitrite reductase, copper-containing [Candidatus Wolfebacteria bacterium]|nr:nitrite reductase, copper-containing [Candidatus Wolfebacteria bacterium]
MTEIFLLARFFFFDWIAWTLAFLALGIILFIAAKKVCSTRMELFLLALFGFSAIFWLLSSGIPSTLAYPWNLTTYGPAAGPSLPVANALTFFKNFDGFERVDDIARDPRDLPGPIERDYEDDVYITIEAREVVSDMAEDVTFNYWTFGGQVPGPFLRVREGDNVHLTLKNLETNIHQHSIDLHAVTGPGGGSAVIGANPGEENTLDFKALNPGLYVYHCATPNVANHMAHGMYGLILVEPKEKLTVVDHEFYVMQGEFYSVGELGRKGLQVFDGKKMLAGDPSYIVFNGRTGALTDQMQVNTGESVRMYVGNGGVNLISSFHIIGEIFDRVFPEAATNVVLENVQTTLVPAGGATMVEFTAEVPGTYILVDHALARLDRGAWGTLIVNGEENPDIYHGDKETSDHTH